MDFGTEHWKMQDRFLLAALGLLLLMAWAANRNHLLRIEEEIVANQQIIISNTTRLNELKVSTNIKDDLRWSDLMLRMDKIEVKVSQLK